MATRPAPRSTSTNTAMNLPPEAQFTCNRLMTLLALFRGTSLDEIRCGTTDKDLEFLVTHGLATNDLNIPLITANGDAVVRHLFKTLDETLTLK